METTFLSANLLRPLWNKHPPLMCQYFDIVCKNANGGDNAPASRCVKSSPPALLFFILTPPLIAGRHELRGVAGA